MEYMKRRPESPISSQIDRLNSAIQSMIEVPSLPENELHSPCSSTFGRQTCQDNFSEISPYEEETLINKFESLLCALERSKMLNEDMQGLLAPVECKLEDAYQILRDIRVFIDFIQTGKPASVSIKLGRLNVQLIPKKIISEFPSKKDIIRGFMEEPENCSLLTDMKCTDTEETQYPGDFPDESLLQMQVKQMNFERKYRLKRLKELDWQLSELALIKKKLDEDKRQIQMERDEIAREKIEIKQLKSKLTETEASLSNEKRNLCLIKNAIVSSTQDNNDIESFNQQIKLLEQRLETARGIDREELQTKLSRLQTQMYKLRTSQVISNTHKSVEYIQKRWIKNGKSDAETALEVPVIKRYTRESTQVPTAKEDKENIHINV